MKKNIKKSEILKFFKERNTIKNVDACIIEWFNYLKSIDIKSNKYVNINIRKNDCDWLTLNDINDDNLKFFLNNSNHISKLKEFRKKSLNFIIKSIDNYTWLATEKKYYRKGKNKLTDDEADIYEIIKRLKSNLKKLDIYNLKETNSINETNYSHTENSLEYSDNKKHNYEKRKKRKKFKLELNNNINNIDKKKDLSFSDYFYSNNYTGVSNEEEKNTNEHYFDFNKDIASSSLSINNNIPRINDTSLDITPDIPINFDDNFDIINRIRQNVFNNDINNSKINFNFLQEEKKFNFDDNVTLLSSTSKKQNDSCTVPSISNNTRKYEKNSISPYSNKNFCSSYSNPSFINTNKTFDDNKKEISQYNNTNVDFINNSYLNVKNEPYNYLSSKMNSFNNNFINKNYLNIKNEPFDFLSLKTNPYSNCSQRVLDFASKGDDHGIHRVNLSHNCMDYNDNVMDRIINNKSYYAKKNDIFSSPALKDNSTDSYHCKFMNNKVSLGDNLKEDSSILQNVLKDLNTEGCNRTHKFNSCYIKNNNHYIKDNVDGFKSRIHNVMNSIRNNKLENGVSQQIKQEQNKTKIIDNYEIQNLHNSEYYNKDMENIINKIIKECKLMQVNNESIKKKIFDISSGSKILKGLVKQESNVVSDNQIQIILKVLNDCHLLNISSDNTTNINKIVDITNFISKQINNEKYMANTNMDKISFINDNVDINSNSSSKSIKSDNNKNDVDIQYKQDIYCSDINNSVTNKNEINVDTYNKLFFNNELDNDAKNNLFKSFNNHILEKNIDDNYNDLSYLSKRKISGLDNRNDYNKKLKIDNEADININKIEIDLTNINYSDLTSSLFKNKNKCEKIEKDILINNNLEYHTSDNEDKNNNMNKTTKKIKLENSTGKYNGENCTLFDSNSNMEIYIKSDLSLSEDENRINEEINEIEVDKKKSYNNNIYNGTNLNTMLISKRNININNMELSSAYSVNNGTTIKNNKEIDS
ncbi:hypothetical protein PIROE2DRAFT_9214, partial [Piromyces sp. E2]